MRLCEQAEQEIRLVMLAETHALAQQDIARYLATLDEESPRWYAGRAQQAQSGMQSDDRPEAATAIQNLDLRGEIAWVEVVGGDPAIHWARFYRRRASGWVETAPDARFWGRPVEEQTGDLVVRYYRRDRSHVGALLPHLTAVVSEVSDDLRYSLAGPRFVLYVGPERTGRDPRVQVSWEGTRVPLPYRREVSLSSPWLTGIPADGQWDEEMLRAVTYQIAHALVSNAMRSANEPDLTALQGALADEYASWVSQGRDPQQAPLLRRVVDRHGEDVLPRMFLSLKGAHLSTLYLVRWLSLHPTGDSEDFFETVLNIEREALLAGRRKTFLLFQDPSWRHDQERFYVQTRATSLDALSPVVRVSRVDMSGTQAHVALAEPAPSLQGLRACSSPTQGGSAVEDESPESALARSSSEAHAIFRRSAKSWDWGRVCMAE
jgi:hypothetical protein